MQTAIAPKTLQRAKSHGRTPGTKNAGPKSSRERTRSLTQRASYGQTTNCSGAPRIKHAEQEPAGATPSHLTEQKQKLCPNLKPVLPARKTKSKQTTDASILHLVYAAHGIQTPTNVRDPRLEADSLQVTEAAGNGTAASGRTNAVGSPETNYGT